MREIQDFEQVNISMTRPTLDSTHIGMNTTNGTTSPIDSIPVVTKTPEPMPMTPPTDFPTLPMDFPEQKGKAHVSGDPDPDLSSSDSSVKKSNL